MFKALSLPSTLNAMLQREEQISIIKHTVYLTAYTGQVTTVLPDFIFKSKTFLLQGTVHNISGKLFGSAVLI